MKRKVRNIIIWSAVGVVVLLLAAFGVYKAISGRRIDVTQVAMLYTTYWGDNETRSGNVTSDSSMQLYLTNEQIVKEVFVNKGDTVAEGDKLFEYDISLQQLELLGKEIEIETIQGNITALNNEIEGLKKMTPVEDKPEPVTEPRVEDESGEGLEDDIEPVPEDTEAEGYTAEEIAEKIDEKSREVKSLKIDLELAKLDYEKAKSSLGDGIVYSTINGTISELEDAEQAKSEGKPFMTVTGEQGYYIKSSLNEFDLNKIKVGDIVSVYSYETDVTCEGKVIDISSIPSQSNDYWSSGNNNVSYYPVTISVDANASFRNGDYVELTLQAPTESTDTIYLDKAYVREENGQKYVFAVGENNKLEKRYIETGKSLWDSYIEIKSDNLTIDDYIAFPYDKNAKEGVTANIKIEEYIDGGEMVYR